ncbi:sulfatase-like hydrolase/transferase [Reichenbachiella sp.]|uniref:sulfatase-like hydrolase/transferase n=1 Tax=Reichenbachiella sp. TaxID=2184521 RepID=UPI003297FEC9
MRNWIVIMLLVLSSSISLAQKNVLFIAVDDLKPMLGAYGDPSILTPNIDALATKGTLFSNASCQQAICAPSRISLLTGLYPDQTRVWDLSTQMRDEDPNVLTLPQYFKEVGYHVAGLGKIFDSRSVSADFDGVSWSVPFIQGMPSEYYFNNNKEKNGYQDPTVHTAAAEYNQYLIDNSITSTADKNAARKLFPLSKPATEGNQDLPDDAYVDGARTNYAFEKLDEAVATGKPFFLAVGFTKPHLPFVAPKKYWDLYSRSAISIDQQQGRDNSIPSIAFHGYGELINAYSDIPSDGQLTVDKQKELIHGYRACVSYVDAQVGRLMSKLDELNLSQNTTIVLWGDHGWHLGDHGLWAKHSNFEQAVRSPLLIYAPHHGLANNVTEAPVEFVDIFPTLCDLAEIDKPMNLSGESLIETMTNPDHRVREAALAQYPRTNGGKRHMGYTLRDERYRYTKWIQMNYYEGLRYGPTHAIELYDYQNDPNETINIAEDPAKSDLVEAFEFLFKKRNIAQNTPSNFLDVSLCNETSYTAPDGQIYTQSGVYSATLEAKNGMDSVITIQLKIAECQSQPNEVLEVESKNKLLSIYPNPIKDGMLHLDWKEIARDITIIVLDFSGKEIIKRDFQNISSTNLEVRGLVGTHLVQVYLDGQASTYKVLFTH